LPRQYRRLFSLYNLYMVLSCRNHTSLSAAKRVRL